jgi:hypothetical protein
MHSPCAPDRKPWYGQSMGLPVTGPFDRVDHLLASDPVRRASQQAAHRGTGGETAIQSAHPWLRFGTMQGILSHQSLG